MHSYRCWSADDGTIDDARPVLGDSPQDAAERFVDTRWADFDHAETVEVGVADQDGKITWWTVDADTSTTFYAFESNPPPEAPSDGK